MLATSGVLVSHAYPLALEPGVTEPLERALGGVTLGTVCVYVFFAISGFFITQSFEWTSTLARFVRARVLRLFPALIVVLVLTVGAASAYWTAVPDYVLRNLTLFVLRWELPGVFTDNPYGGAINGSLWTLSYEVLCYAGVTLLGLVGVLRRKWAVVIALAVRLIPGAEPLFRPAFVLALSYATFWLGYLPVPALRVYNRLGDYSYGVYIYAFPAQQLVAYWGTVTALGNMVAAALIVLPCAVLSWHLIEKPALALKSLRRPVSDKLGERA